MLAGVFERSSMYVWIHINPYKKGRCLSPAISFQRVLVRRVRHRPKPQPMGILLADASGFMEPLNRHAKPKGGRPQPTVTVRQHLESGR
jgi:hypothetical protein